jgi:hypothetical protein
VVSTPLKNISQLGLFFPIHGQIKVMFQTTNQSYRWINPTSPTYNWGHKSLTNWDEPPSIETYRNHPPEEIGG